MSNILYCVVRRVSADGWTYKRDVFYSVFLDKAIEKAADFACAHPGKTYFLEKRNVMTQASVVLDTYCISGGESDNC